MKNKKVVSYDLLGMRFSKVLALAPNDFDFSHQMLVINKTCNYKGNSRFLPTKSAN